jgi:hypothetical protein
MRLLPRLRQGLRLERDRCRRPHRPARVHAVPRLHGALYRPARLPAALPGAQAADPGRPAADADRRRWLLHPDQAGARPAGENPEPKQETTMVDPRLPSDPVLPPYASRQRRPAAARRRSLGPPVAVEWQRFSRPAGASAGAAGGRNRAGAGGKRGLGAGRDGPPPFRRRHRLVESAGASSKSSFASVPNPTSRKGRGGAGVIGARA